MQRKALVQTLIAVIPEKNPLLSGIKMKSMDGAAIFLGLTFGG
jgi:hypothetical protein